MQVYQAFNPLQPSHHLVLGDLGFTSEQIEEHLALYPRF